MVTAIELHSNQQQAQGPQYGANIQSSTMTNNSPRGGPKSPPLSSPNGMVSPSGRSQGKKSSHAKALSLQTKLAQATGSSKSSPLTALSSPSIPGHASQERGASSRRGSKRTLEDALAVEKPTAKQDLLTKYKNSKASFTIHFYETHFKFENQIFLKCVQERRLPSGLLDVIKSADCPYYEGRLIVEIVDHRNKAKPATHTPTAETPTVAKMEIDTHTTKRVVLSPTQETLWADLSLLHEESGEAWSAQTMLEVESKVLIATEEPLCLDPSPMVTVLSNQIHYHQTSAALRTRKKRKWNSLEREQEAVRKLEEDKLMSMMDEKSMVDFQPSFGRLAFLKEWRHKKKLEETQLIPVLDPKKSKAKRQEMSILPDGRKIVRTIRFEREDKKRAYKMYFMFSIMQCPDLSFEAIMRYGTAPDSAVNGGTRRYARLAGLSHSAT
ncbi:Transcription factor spt20 [Podila horticola]|nr:Transcription factor spt20 [Podila horticola]